MSLISAVEQSTQLQNELNINTETGHTMGQGGLAVRTDLRAGIGENVIDTLQDGWSDLLDKISSLTDG